LILTVTGQDSPSVLPFWVSMWRNCLPWLDMPCNDD
jgi:hypothetical protein